MLGLDKPWYVQYFNWLGGIFQGDLGTSLTPPHNSVNRAIADRLPNTIEIGVITIILSAVVSVPVGIISAVRRNTALDYVLRGGTILGISVPNFWTVAGPFSVSTVASGATSAPARPSARGSTTTPSSPASAPATASSRPRSPSSTRASSGSARKSSAPGTSTTRPMPAPSGRLPPLMRRAIPLPTRPTTRSTRASRSTRSRTRSSSRSASSPVAAFRTPLACLSR